MNEELKPCPFCNNPVFVDITDEEGNYPKRPEYEQDPYSGLCYVLVHPYNEVDICPIGCNEGEYMGVIYDTREEAVAAWNRRAEPFGISDELPSWFVELLKKSIINLQLLAEEMRDEDIERSVQASRWANTLLWVLSLRRGDGE